MKKRMAIRLVLLLLAGAIINVTVAWGCGLLLPFPSTYQSISDIEKEYWQSFLAHEQRAGSFSAFHQICGYRDIIAFDASDNLGFGFVLVNGWPAFSVVGSLYLDGPSHRKNCLFTRSLDDVRWWTPWRPIWPGFAINTIFYAGILWLLFAAPGMVRRRIRILRHHCPTCAYPVGASAVCTECGAPARIQKP